MIHLEQITTENIDDVLNLRVHENQSGFVASTAESLAKTYVYKDTSFPFAVYYDSQLVGFIMMGYYKEKRKDYYTLWEFLIDKNFQHKGFGRKALELGINFLKEKFNVSEVYTGVSPGNDVARALYKSVGFEETGVFEDGMDELRLKIK